MPVLEYEISNSLQKQSYQFYQKSPHKRCTIISPQYHNHTSPIVPFPMWFLQTLCKSLSFISFLQVMETLLQALYQMLFSRNREDTSKHRRNFPSTIRKSDLIVTMFLTQGPICNSLGQLDYLVTFKGPIINGAPFNICFFGSHLGKQSYDKSVNKLPIEEICNKFSFYKFRLVTLKDLSTRKAKFRQDS